jgi:anti-sigma-K factor RskA
MVPDPNKRRYPPTRVTLSGGKKAQPRLMMAHPMGEDNRRRDWRQVILVIAIVVIIVLAGASRR